MISDILNEGRIKIPLNGKTKEEVLSELVDLIEVGEKEVIFKKILERERRMSTGIGKGIALPRYRGNEVGGIVAAFGIIPEGVNFFALDDNPVRFLFFVAAGEREDEGYVEALSRMARILNQEGFQDHILKRKNAKEIFALLKREEEELWK